nr:4-hydroxyphenylacetate decarboxylase small subunit [Bacteroidota bacterium]
MTHYDCKYYLATDVFKGFCKRDKSRINADEASCEHFEKATKCKHCHNFTLSGEQVGLCMDKADAFPEMIAVTCKDFSWGKN